MNPSGIRPIGDQVLLLPEQVSQTTDSGIQIMTDKEMDRLELAQVEGVVVEISQKMLTSGPLEFSVGQRVVFAKYAGLLLDGDDGKRYRLIETKDIKGVYENV